MKLRYSCVGRQWSEAALQADEPVRDIARSAVLGDGQSGRTALQDLVDITELDAYSGKVSQHAAAAARRKVLPQGVHQRGVGEVGAAELYVAGGALLSETRAVKSEPATVVNLAGQRLNLLGNIEGTVACLKVAEARERLRLYGGYPMAGGEMAVPALGDASSGRER